MHTRLVLAICLAGGCASHEGDPPKSPIPTKVEPDDGAAEPDPDAEPEPDPDAEPEPKVAQPAIASVQMIQDCPDPVPPPPPAGATSAPAQPMPAKPTTGAVAPSRKRTARGSSGRGIRQPCTQSTLQLSFAEQGDAPGRVVIERVRMLDASSSKELATIAARRPMAWVDGSYRAWDEIVPANASTKASYSLRVPDWTDVERKIGGGSSFGHMFVVEVDLTVDGARQTLRSPTFTRERPHRIVT